MNWRRGVIRLCLVGSMFWVVAVGWLTWSYDNTSLVHHIYKAVVDRGDGEHAFDVWRAAVDANARPWKDMKTRIWANHGLQRPKLATLGDLEVMLGNTHAHWTEKDFCAKEFDGIVVTEAECDELRRVAAEIPALPMPPEGEEWIARKKMSVEPLLEWAGAVFLPPIATLLVAFALLWALRGFRPA